MKKYLCILLTVLMIFSALSILNISAENSDEIITYRYYFYLPDEWKNQYSSTAYIYWWNGTNAHSSAPGVEGIKTDIEGLYYYDVPQDVEYICWSNGVLFNEDIPDNYSYIRCTYVETFNNNNKVYVIDHDKTVEHTGLIQNDYFGQWYYYYGDGEYGLYEKKGEEFYTCSSFGGNNPAPVIETNRYYFYMPEDWENILSGGVSVYWWEGTNNCRDFWPGYKAHSTNIKGLYYYDVPKNVWTIIWNNQVLDDKWSSGLAMQSKNLGVEYYEPGESNLYPEGLDSFNNMVYVINYDDIYYELEGPVITGDWYYYYGNGEYGTTPEKGETFYNTRHLGTPIDRKYSNPSEDEITIYFLEKFNRSPISITYCYGDEEIVETCELSAVAHSETGTLYSAKIPKSSYSIYFSDENRRTLDISKYITHNACFEFGTTLENNRYDYKSYLLNEHLDKLDVLTGDVNTDGKVSIQDATAIQKHLANITELGGKGKTAADFNSDGKITIKDATAIQKFLAKAC